ncbi:unnamed protein product [Peronospora destructor]|uniref:Uncharacterized protein n=1 Tax=Peronospora destructor TaxID=86335 RepID=A0AAV0VFE8_9STRA|nr:unnamed protein product [Peronospora destructor]
MGLTVSDLWSHVKLPDLWMGSSGEKKIRASPAWREDLITEGNLRDLMNSRPWDKWVEPVKPLSFPISGCQLSTWYPGAEGGDPQAGPSEVLQAADDAAPWRIFYRKNLQKHPAFEIPRLPSKFYPPDGD